MINQMFYLAIIVIYVLVISLSFVISAIIYCIAHNFRRTEPQTQNVINLLRDEHQLKDFESRILVGYFAFDCSPFLLSLPEMGKEKTKLLEFSRRNSCLKMPKSFFPVYLL